MNKLATTQTQASAYRAFADEDAASAIAGDMILYNKGLWTRGEGKTPVPTNAQFIANLDEGYRGMVRWSGGKPVDHRIGRIVDRFPMPQLEELSHRDESKWETDEDGNPRDPWTVSYRLVMKDAATGELVTFVTGSWGGQRAFRIIYGQFDQGKHQHPGCWPVVRLETEYRQNKRYGPIPEPRLTVVGWRAWDEKKKAKPVTPKRIASVVRTEDDPRTLARELEDEIPY
jgi:hypothetical protein